MKRDLCCRRSPVLPAILLLTLIFGAPAHAQQSGWTLQNSGTNSWLLGADFVSSTTGWAVGDAGTIIKTTTSGVSWAPETSGTSIPLQAVDFVSASTGWAVGGLGASGVILRTTNGGATWARQDTVHNLTGVAFVNATTGWAVGTSGLMLRTTNGGTNWNTVPDGGASENFTSVTFVGPDSGWIAGKYPGTLLRTTDAGTTWIPETTGVSMDDDINSLYFVDRLNGWMAGLKIVDTLVFGMIKRTTDGGITWIDQTSNTDQELFSVAFVNLQEGWCVGTNGVLLHTTDGGNLWLPENSGVGTLLNRIVVRPGEGGWIFGLGGAVLLNDFGGLTQQRSVAVGLGWNMLALPLSSSDRRKTSVYPTASSFAFGYDVTQGYFIDDTLDIGRGYWIKFTAAQTVTITGSPVSFVTVDLTPGWNLVGGISSDVPVANIIQNPPNSITTIYSYSTTSGYQPATLIVSGAAHWIKARQTCQITIQAGGTMNVSRQFLTDASLFDNNELPPPPPPGGEDAAAPQEPLPEVFALHQNYPNPFNPSTNIAFDLPERSMVRVTVYNVMGQEVARLADGQADRGVHRFTWDASDGAAERLASGIYICRLSAKSLESGAEFTGIVKMLLIE